MFDVLPDGFHKISAAAWIAVTWIAVSIPFVVLGFMAGLPFGFGALAIGIGGLTLTNRALIQKFYGSRFDPVLTIAGMLVFICGAYGLVVVFSSLPYTILITPIFLLPTVMGIVTLVREYQLWRSR